MESILNKIDELKKLIECLPKEDIEKQLLPTLCILTKDVGDKVDYNVGKKFDEIISAYVVTGLKVMSHPNGVDAIDHNGEPVEIKSSTIKKIESPINVNFKPLTYNKLTHASKESYAKAVYDDAISKGRIEIVVTVPNQFHSSNFDHNYYIHKDGKWFYKAMFSKEFIAEYMRQRILLYPDAKWKKVNNINIGGRLCPTCGIIHRIRYLQECDRLFTDKNRSLPFDWNTIFNNHVPYKC